MKRRSKRQPSRPIPIRAVTKSEAAGYWGVVEGFYGRPWTADQRKELCSWMADAGLTSYFYTPKDDPKHRALWPQLYTASERSWMEPLIRSCDRRGIRFIYGLAPGLSQGMQAAEVERLLVRKVLSLQELGCRHFALLFDDIPAEGAKHYLQRYGSWAGAHIAWTHRVREALLKRDPQARFLFCPTPYCEAFSGPIGESAYLHQLGRELSSDVEIFWTGKDIVSRTIKPGEMRELSTVIGRPPVIWDNLFANDYDMRRLYLGPYAGRPQELKSTVRGIFINPNCEYRANFIPLRSFADYIRGGKNWSVERSYSQAQKAWRDQFIDLKGTLPTPAQMRLLCDSLHLPFHHGRVAARALDDARITLRSKGTRTTETGQRLRRWATGMADWHTRMTELRDRDLTYTLYRHVWELKEEGDLLLRYLSWLQDKTPGRKPFRSLFHQPGTYRGGLASDLQHCLKMKTSGEFQGV